MPTTNSGGGGLQELLQLLNDLPEPQERRRLREAAGLSQNGLARSIGVSQSALCYWEAGLRVPRLLQLRVYVKALRKLREVEATKAAPPV